MRLLRYMPGLTGLGLVIAATEQLAGIAAAMLVTGVALVAIDRQL